MNTPAAKSRGINIDDLRYVSVGNRTARERHTERQLRVCRCIDCGVPNIAALGEEREVKKSSECLKDAQYPLVFEVAEREDFGGISL